MEEIENDFLVDNIQKNTNQESQLHNQCDEEQVEYNSQLFSDELFNRNQIKISNKSSFQNIKLSPNNNDAIYNESPQKQNNADISGLSLLKELEDRWDIVEKRKMYYYNKNNDVQNNYINIYNKGSELKEKEKYKAIKDLVEKNKNIFIFKQNNARKKRENDNEKNENEKKIETIIIEVNDNNENNENRENKENKENKEKKENNENIENNEINENSEKNNNNEQKSEKSDAKTTVDNNNNKQNNSNPNTISISNNKSKNDLGDNINISNSFSNVNKENNNNNLIQIKVNNMNNNYNSNKNSSNYLTINDKS